MFLEQWCFRERDGLPRQRANTGAVTVSGCTAG
jgi:hypothetical protein